MIEKLTDENRALRRQVTAHSTSAKQWERVANDCKCDLDAAYKRIDVLHARLSKFDRQRGDGGKYVKKV